MCLVCDITWGFCPEIHSNLVGGYCVDIRKESIGRVLRLTAVLTYSKGAMKGSFLTS